MMSSTPPLGRPCVFLDRDGTLHTDVGYTYRPEQLVLLPAVARSLAALRSAGLLLIVVTNQSGIARGYYTPAQVDHFHHHLDQRLGAAAAPDAYYYCPFHPEATASAYRLDSPLRKPSIGMFEQARRDFDIDPQRSFMIGNNLTDMEFAARAGLRAVLLADSNHSAAGGHAYLVRPDFAAAADAILALQVCGQDAWCSKPAIQPQ